LNDDSLPHRAGRGFVFFRDVPSIRKPDSQKLPIPLNPVRQPVFQSLFVVAFGLLFFPAFQAF
jgi:hypothetical protein